MELDELEIARGNNVVQRRSSQMIYGWAKMATKKNAQPNQSLIDGIAALQALATLDAPVGGRELARQLGFEPTRLNRLLKTLAYVGIARQTADRKYTSGPGMHVLAAQSLFASGLIRRSLPVLEELREFNCTVAMGVLWRDNVSYLYHARPGMASAEALGRIGVLPATGSGIGLSILSSLDSDDVKEIYYNRDILGFPEGIEALLARLDQIRRGGFAHVLVRPELDQYTLAVNVGDPVHAAVALSGFIPEERVPKLVEALLEAKGKIEQPE